MKVAFVSNYFNHHQKPFCDEMFHLLGTENFRFVANEKVSDWRKKLGYKEMTADYVVDYDSSIDDFISKCDVVIYGHVEPFHNQFIKARLKEGKIVVKQSERIYKNDTPFYHKLYHLIKYRFLFGKSPNAYLLATSAYAAYDYSQLHVFKNHMLKWAYFPEVKEYDIDTLWNNKQPKSILWVSRFIDWKHPELVLTLAQYLKRKGVDFSIKMVGEGELRSYYEQEINKFGLMGFVSILGSMSPEEVRKHMEESEIFLFTSDKKEGWGAVLNESMNSACAVVACDQIGAVPFLIEDGKNGMVFNNEQIMCEKVFALLNDYNKRKEIGSMAYNTLFKTWNASIAAARFVQYFESKINGTDIFYDSGPCSPAAIIKG